ncbi:MAG: tetratricopeptide repeat protein [Muribaculaceae bacterium]|nr:tetratricopeptide repeat protein [Muribaculaceae bacterium]
MKKRFGLVMAMIMVAGAISPLAYAFTNPLKNYNLYDDVNPQSSDEREQVMSEVLMPRSSGSSSSAVEDPYSNPNFGKNVDVPKSRNQDLRESSRNVYADNETTPGWLEGPSFYPNPSFSSIVAKYKKSDFAGCLQECISYVRKHPGDTLGFYYLAMCYTKVSDMDNAVKAYERVIALNDNPMIVKYATNGRNCIMDNDKEKCYPNVNEPELVYPFAHIPASNLTPVDPESLVRRNFAMLKEQLSPFEPGENNSDNANSNDKDKKSKIQLPFGNQDAELDQFINAPYGNGLDPKLNQEYKQLQLKKIQGTINLEGDSKDDVPKNMKYIKDFDNHKSDSETIKLAYEIPQNEWEALSKDPEFIKSKQEYEELHMLLGGSSDSKDSMDDLLPYMSESGSKNLSPEVIQAMMMKSVMGDLNL